jgi:hypothetical protein
MHTPTSVVPPRGVRHRIGSTALVNPGGPLHDTSMHIGWQESHVVSGLERTKGVARERGRGSTHRNVAPGPPSSHSPSRRQRQVFSQMKSWPSVGAACSASQPARAPQSRTTRPLACRCRRCVSGRPLCIVGLTSGRFTAQFAPTAGAVRGRERQATSEAVGPNRRLGRMQCSGAPRWLGVC